MSEHSSQNVEAPGWLRTGKHLLRREGDILVLKIIGNVNLEEMRCFLTEGFALGERYGYVLTLLNAQRAGFSTAEARKYQAEALRQRIFPSCGAVYGASIFTRGALALMQRAVKLVTGQDAPTIFTADEASGRTVLAAARQRFIDQGIAKPSTP